MNRGNIKYLWIIVGAYLIHLGVGQYQFVYNGEAELPVVSILFGTLFIAVGVWVIWREWQAYQYAKAHKDDPETWASPDGDEAETDSENPEEDEEAADGGPAELPEETENTEDTEDAEDMEDEEGEEEES